MTDGVLDQDEVVIEVAEPRDLEARLARLEAELGRLLKVLQEDVLNALRELPRKN